MVHEKIKLSVSGSADYAAMYTYFLDLSPEIPVKKRPTVVVCPGGAYAFTSDREAEPIALGLNAAGINAVVVRYSVAPARFPTALLEVATAVQYVREKGEAYGCDPEKIFVIGFSAGGHLAASYGNFWSRPFVAEALGCASETLRPNGQILSYPVISSGPFAHHDSIKNLLGERYETEKENQSLENFVTKDTPPTFIWHTQTDDCVPVENSLLFVSALQKVGVKTEFHLFPEGGHGLSLCNPVTSNNPDQLMPHVAKWFNLAVEFIWSISNRKEG